MKMLTLTDSNGQKRPCLYSRQPEPPEVLIAAMSEADYLAIGWEYPSAKEELRLLEDVLGERLLAPEPWQKILHRAGTLIGSSISGGDLKTRFSDAEKAFPGRCWLSLERLCVAIPLPCPDGQGQKTQLPEHPGFYSESLGCRYLHSPGQVILFDTEETLEQKRLRAMEAGFLGWLQVD